MPVDMRTASELERKEWGWPKSDIRRVEPTGCDPRPRTVQKRFTIGGSIRSGFIRT